MKSYYDILEINEDASEEEIKKAFRKQAMKWHPDRNIGNDSAEEKFKEMKLAYDVLIDSYKRKQYDFSRKNEAKKENKKPNDNFFENSFSEESNYENSETIAKVSVNVDFWDAVFGCNKTFEVFLDNQKKRVTINIPKGTHNDEEFIFNINNSNIKFHITVKTSLDDKFTRNNLDLFTNIELPFTMAALGGKLIFPHWDGEFEVLIPAGVKPNQTILLANKGIKRDMFVGDLYLICNISIPKKLTPKQKALLEEFQKTELEQPNSIFESIRNTWKNVFKSN